MEKNLKRIIASSGKKIEIKVAPLKIIENRKGNENSEVLWPTDLPDDLDIKAYLPFEARPVSGNLGPFSSEQGRQLLERELFSAGMKIRAASKSPDADLRPLGRNKFGLGFGSMIVTFRNCPNTCPLALWWGDPDADTTSPLSKWYPLFKRKTYNESLVAEIRMLIEQMKSISGKNAVGT